PAGRKQRRFGKVQRARGARIFVCVNSHAGICSRNIARNPWTSTPASLPSMLMNQPQITHPIYALVATVLSACALTARAETLPAADQLPAIPQLPDPFLFPDSSRVKSKADWQRRREQIKEMV